MAPEIRLATAGDVSQWLELVHATIGAEYPAKEIYDPVWIKAQFDRFSGQETWVADLDGRVMASISLLKPTEGNPNPIANVGRNLFLPESFSNGSAKALLKKVNEIAMERGLILVARMPASANQQQILFESMGYSCVGFQPLKHMLQTRVGILFYVRAANQVLMTRIPMSESLSQISEIAAITFEKLKISNPMTVRDGAIGYPLQTEVTVRASTLEEYKKAHTEVEAANPPVEISKGFNLGSGLIRTETPIEARTILGIKEGKTLSGITFIFDEHDRCIRLIDAFAADDLSFGGLFQHIVRIAQEQFGAVYIEVDILASAPRLLKTAEQLGFVPVAYLPAFFCRNGTHADVVKMVKLNMPYALENVDFTSEARSVAEIVDRNFQDQKVGVAIINMLRGLPFFDGLGDGELRKIARLFVQKLYRPGEQVFKKGDSGDAVYVVMRGQIDIQLEEASKPIASVGSGKIFGELAFLDGAPRNAYAVAGQPSILLVVQRTALNELVQREPHLGMVIMRNVAMDLSNKIRQANATIASLRK